MTPAEERAQRAANREERATAIRARLDAGTAAPGLAEKVAAQGHGIEALEQEVAALHAAIAGAYDAAGLGVTQERPVLRVIAGGS